MQSHNNNADSTKKNWKPDRHLVSQIQEEIKQSFDAGSKSLFDQPDVVVSPEPPEQSFISECAKIGAFLMDEAAVLKQLERLNSILEDKINKGADPNDVYLLRQTIEEELGKLGFHPNLGKAIAIVQPENFRMAIAHGLALKDPTLGNKQHGEFTHALQWLAIAWQQEDSNFLGRRAVDVFKELGEEKSVFSRTASHPMVNAPREEKSIWDIIVDDPDREFSGFRSPEKLNNHLMAEDIKSLVELQRYLHQRTEKRFKSLEYAKYSKSQLTSSSVFSRKTGRIPYSHSDVKNVMTPKNINIDVKSFNERSSKRKGKKQ